MCRLYGFHANEPTKTECSLVHAQNALMEQSREDLSGVMHGHGWGVANYPNGTPKVEKQTWAAYHGEHFKKAAARVYAKTVIAHVRRATVGPPAIENTHPFTHGPWLFAHNGTIPNFDQIRPKFLDAIDPMHRNEIHGVTDSEHVFRYLLTLWSQHPEHNLRETLQLGLRQIIQWSYEIDPAAAISLNVLWSDGEHMAGSRINRTLWFLERDRIVPCEICGKSHVHHDPKQEYLSVEVASEPITHEDWKGVPNGTVFNIDPDVHLHFEPLEVEPEILQQVIRTS